LAIMRYTNPRTHSLTHSLTHLSSVSEQKPLSTLSLPVKHFVPLSLSVSELFSVICHDLPSGSISAAGPCPRAAANPPVTAAATIDGTDGLLVPPTRLAYVSALLFVNRYAFVCRYLHLTEFSFLPLIWRQLLPGIARSKHDNASNHNYGAFLCFFDQ